MMIFYHATSDDSVLSLLERGADPAKIGENGGSQDGVGFYLSRAYYDAVYWGNKLFTGKWTILQIILPDTLKIASEQTIKEANKHVADWGLQQGYLILEESGAVPTEKMLQAHRISREEWDEDLIKGLGMNSTLMGLYLKDQGYVGYCAGDSTVVITDFSLLKHFSLASEPH